MAATSRAAELARLFSTGSDAEVLDAVRRFGEDSMIEMKRQENGRKLNAVMFDTTAYAAAFWNSSIRDLQPDHSCHILFGVEDDTMEPVGGHSLTLTCTLHDTFG